MNQQRINRIPQFLSQSPKRIIQWIFILHSFILGGVTGLTAIIVDSGRPKCVTIDSPQDTVIRVVYEAPGECLTKKAACFRMNVFYTSICFFLSFNMIN